MYRVLNFTSRGLSELLESPPASAILAERTHRRGAVRYAAEQVRTGACPQVLVTGADGTFLFTRETVDMAIPYRVLCPNWPATCTAPAEPWKHANSKTCAACGNASTIRKETLADSNRAGLKGRARQQAGAH